MPGPSSSRLPKGRRSWGFTVRGWGCLVVAALCLVVAGAAQIDGLVFVAAFLGVLAGAAQVSAHSRRGRFAIHRDFSDRHLSMGHPSDTMVTLENIDRRMSAPALWSDRWRRRSRGVWSSGDAESTPTSSLPAMQSRGRGASSSIRLHYAFTPSRRGVYEVGPLELFVTDPFAVAYRRVSVGGAHEVTVLPVIEELPETALALPDADGSARRLSFRSTGGNYDLSTRDYRAGDPLRRVHWRASAHHGELMVRQEEQRSSAEVAVLLESRAAAYPDSTRGRGSAQLESADFERAVSLVASLASHLDDGDMRVRVLETGPAQIAPDMFGFEAVEALATIAPIGGADASVSDLSGAGHGGSLFAVVPGVDSAMVPSLIELRSRFALAVLFVVESGPAAELGVDAALLERAELVALSAVGWKCVAVPPGAAFSEVWATLAASVTAGRGG